MKCVVVFLATVAFCNAMVPPRQQCDSKRGPELGPCRRARCVAPPPGCVSANVYERGDRTCCPKLCHFVDSAGDECLPGCREDSLVCNDETVLVRDPANNCEFPECPSETWPDQPENCPIRQPEMSSACSRANDGLTCVYGKECCCGECHPSVSFDCHQEQWTMVHLEACMMPPCEMSCHGCVEAGRTWQIGECQPEGMNCPVADAACHTTRDLCDELEAGKVRGCCETFGFGSQMVQLPSNFEDDVSRNDCIIEDPQFVGGGQVHHEEKTCAEVTCDRTTGPEVGPCLMPKCPSRRPPWTEGCEQKTVFVPQSDGRCCLYRCKYFDDNDVECVRDIVVTPPPE